MELLRSIMILFSLLFAMFSLSVFPNETGGYDSIIAEISSWGVADLTKTGYECLERGEYDKALAYYTIVVSKNKDLLSKDEKREYIKSLNNIGYIFLFEKYNTEKAYPYFLKARSLAEQAGEDDLLGAVLDNMAKVHDDFGDSEKAIELYNLAMKHAVKSNTTVSPVIQLMVLNDMVNCAMSHDMTDKIGPSLDKFNRLPEYSIPMAKYSKMMCRALQLLLNDKVDEASDIMANAEKYINSKTDSARYVTDHKLTMANLYHMRHIEDSALIYLHHALENSRAHSLADRMPRIYRGMALVKAALGDSVESNRMQLLSYEADQQLHSSKMYAYLNTLEAAHQIDNLNIKLMEADMRHSHRVAVIWILAVAIAVIVSLLTYTVIRNRRLSASLRELVARHQESISTEEAHGRLRHEYENTIAALRQEVEALAGNKTESMPAKDAQTVQKGIALPIDEKERLRIIGEVHDIFDKSDEIYDPDFSLERLAERTATKPRYLSSLLNEAMGRSFSVLLAEARVKKACALLLSPDFRKTKTIESIAFEVGYRSRTHFTSVFKKITGVTPLQYEAKADK